MKRRPMERLRGLISAGYHRMVTLEDTPRSIALGAALGVLGGMTPTYGFQMIIIFFVNSLFRVNRVAGLILVYVTNPITAIPIYWLDYKLGAHMLWRPEAVQREGFEDRLSALSELPFLEALREFVGLGWGILGPMFVGGLMLGAVCGALTYPVVLVGVIRYKEKRALRRARRKLRETEETTGEKTPEEPVAEPVPAAPIDAPDAEIGATPVVPPVSGGNGHNRIAGQDLADEAPSPAGGEGEEDEEP